MMIMMTGLTATAELVCFSPVSSSSSPNVPPGPRLAMHLEPRELSVIDDTGEIGVACRVGVAFGNLSAECGDEAFHLIDMDEGIVSGDAGLAGVEQLAEH